MGVSVNLWIVVKDVKTLVVYDAERDGYGFNELEMCFILSLFGVHQSFLRS